MIIFKPAIAFTIHLKFFHLERQPFTFYTFGIHGYRKEGENTKIEGLLLLQLNIVYTYLYICIFFYAAAKKKKNSLIT